MPSSNFSSHSQNYVIINFHALYVIRFRITLVFEFKLIALNVILTHPLRNTNRDKRTHSFTRHFQALNTTVSVCYDVLQPGLLWEQWLIDTLATAL